MNDLREARSLSTVAALLVLAVFAVGILSVLLGGASAYRRLIRRDQQIFESRTAMQYLATKVHQASGPDEVSVAPFGQAEALVIRQEIEGEQYVTRIYCHGGWLMELFSTAQGEFAPEDGEKLLPAAQMTAELRDGLLTLMLTDEQGSTRQLRLQIRGGEVAA